VWRFYSCSASRGYDIHRDGAGRVAHSYQGTGITAWLDSAGQFLNRDPQNGVSQIDREQVCVVVDGALSNPEGLATASAALYDVRTGFVYGVAESTATEKQRATVWSSAAAVDASRVRAGHQAYQGLLGEYEKPLRGIVREHQPAG
jgi:hypothetical protein